jgi:hypothetical protein
MPSKEPFPVFGTAEQAAPNGMSDMLSLADGLLVGLAGADVPGTDEDAAELGTGLAASPPPQAANARGRLRAAATAAILGARK